MDSPSSHQLSPASGADAQDLVLGGRRRTPSLTFVLSFKSWPSFKASFNPTFTTQPHATSQPLLSTPFADLSQHLPMILGIETFVRKPTLPWIVLSVIHSRSSRFEKFWTLGSSSPGLESQLGHLNTVNLETFYNFPEPQASCLEMRVLIYPSGYYQSRLIVTSSIHEALTQWVNVRRPSHSPWAISFHSHKAP